MILSGLHAFAYCLAAILALTWMGNIVCQLLFHFTGMKGVGRVSAGVDRAGHLIGWLERLIIAVGILCHSWEVVAAVIALKTIGRFKELDETVPAEYFLVGSLFSLLWAFLISGLWLAYDHGIGHYLRKRSAELINPVEKDASAKTMRVSISLPQPAPIASATHARALDYRRENATHRKDRNRRSEDSQSRAIHSAKSRSSRACRTPALHNPASGPASAAGMHSLR